MTSTADSASPFFILSSWRAGSTLLGMMLDVHRNIVTILESRWFADISPRIHGFDHATTPEFVDGVEELLRTSAYLEQLEVPEETLRQVLVGNDDSPDKILAALAEDYISRTKPSARLWGEKSCLHSLYIPQINQAFPSAKFIHLIRDPRATVNSIAKKSFGDASNDWGVATHAYYRFNGRIEDDLRQIPAERNLRVRYEDLVSSTAETLQRCCVFLGADFDESMLDHARFTRKEEVLGSATARSAVTAQFLDEWRTSLSPEEIRCIELFTQRLESTASYPPADLAVFRPALLSSLLVLNTKHLALRSIEHAVGRLRGRPFVYAALRHHMRSLLSALGAGESR